MHKRILAIVSMLCAVPLIASAWTLNTWVRSQGGNVKVGNYAKSTVLTGSTFKSYTSTNGYNAVITADANYFINNLIIDGVPTTPTSSTSMTIAVPSGASSIWVDFLRNQLTFNVVAGANGIVTPSGAQPNVYTGATYRVFSFIPAKGQSVTAVTADVPANIIFSTTALNQVNKKVIVTVSKITGNVTLTGTFSGTISTSGSGSAPTIAQAGRACDACHIAQGIDKSAAAILQPWSSSGHKRANVLCADCHRGANTGSHPGLAVTNTTCQSCHDATLSRTTHPAAITDAKCLDCHSSHNPAAGIVSLGQSNHPAVTLYTFEEIGMQMAGGAKVPVQVDASGKGMPYSPKQSCGTAGCHVKNGVDYTYDKISDHAFHSNQGRSEYVDSATGKFDATKNKPWTQSTAMVGKW